MIPDYLTAGYECRASAGNGNRGVRFYLCKMCIRDVHVVLGMCVRVQLPSYMVRYDERNVMMF